MSLASRSATTLTTLCANDISGESDTFEDVGGPPNRGCIGCVTTGGARPLQPAVEVQAPTRMTASFERA